MKRVQINLNALPTVWMLFECPRGARWSSTTQDYAKEPCHFSGCDCGGKVTRVRDTEKGEEASAWFQRPPSKEEVECPTCKGHGDEMNYSGTGFVTCPRCHGHKKVKRVKVDRDDREGERRAEARAEGYYGGFTD